MPHPEHNHPHHQEAARHHDAAAKSHREAAKLHDEGKLDAAASYALTAHGHTLHALHHSEEAIKARADIQASVQRP